MNVHRLRATHALEGTVRVPGSKSLSNRALLLAALAPGTTRLHGLLESDDTIAMRSALTALGVDVRGDSATCTIHGVGGTLRSSKPITLDLGLAGTALRPLAAALAAGTGEFTLDGTARMRERPVNDLVDALRSLGAQIDYLHDDGYPPLRVSGRPLRGGEVKIRGDVSSQFLTALLMLGPLLPEPLTVQVVGDLVSKPYIDITAHLLRRFGASVDTGDYQSLRVEPTGYQSPGDLDIEADASSATYFLAAGAVRGAGVTVERLGTDSVQGDIAFVDALEQMGAQVTRRGDSLSVAPGGKLRGIDADMNHIPDAAMTAAAIAVFADGPTHIRNIGNWRVKETDRLQAMANELRKVGAAVEEHTDSLRITPPARLTPARIRTYGDHRMAMCFALMSLGGIDIEIEDPGCVNKTFPTFFDVWEQAAHR